MEESIYLTAEKLKSALNNHPSFIALNKAEEKMNSDKEVIKLAYAKDMALNEYNDILRYYSSDSEEAKKYQKKLYEAKKKLEEHPLVREYLRLYQEVRKLYEEINGILFSSLNTSMCPKENK